MSVRFPDMIKKTPGTEKIPDTEKFTPDTIIHDTFRYPKSHRQLVGAGWQRVRLAHVSA